MSLPLTKPESDYLKVLLSKQPEDIAQGILLRMADDNVWRQRYEVAIKSGYSHEKIVGRLEKNKADLTKLIKKVKKDNPVLAQVYVSEIKDIDGMLEFSTAMVR